MTEERARFILAMREWCVATQWDGMYVVGPFDGFSVVGLGAGRTLATAVEAALANEEATQDSNPEPQAA